MAVIIFVRHGQALTNQLGILSDENEGYPLTEEGIATVSRTAQELGKLGITKIYAGPILRARQTAEIIGKPVELKPIIDDRLRDRGFGEFLGKAHKGGEWIMDIDWNTSTVEKSGAVQERMMGFMDSISNGEGIIVVVSHEDTIKSVVLCLMKLDYDVFHFGIKISNSGMTMISRGKDGYNLLAVNYPLLPEWLVAKINREANVSGHKAGKA
jgi:probable phosphoglycerate mutase